MFSGLLSGIVTGWLLVSTLFLFPVASAPFTLPALPDRAGPKRVNLTSVGIKTSARAVLVVDQASGASLYRKGTTLQLPLASLTKLMTALVWLESGHTMEEPITIEPQDIREGNIVYLRPGDQVKAGGAFTLMLVGSSNEAAAALTRVADPKQFVSRMNAKAQALGMSRTFFQDSAGLDPRTVSTAEDVARLLSAALADPIIASTSRRESASLNTVAGRRITVENTNQLLDSFLNRGQLTILGAKTGHLNEVGYNLATVIELADGPSLELILLGASSPADRLQEAKGLVDWVLRSYEWR